MKSEVKRLNERIGIYTMTPSSGLAPREDEEELLFECWAKLRTQTITDIEKNYSTDFKDVIQIVIRQLQDYKITNKMKIKYDGEMFNIFKINSDRANKNYMFFLLNQ